MENDPRDHISIHNQLTDVLKEAACEPCSGRGKLDDSDDGDIYCNHWICPHCKGTGFSKEGEKLVHKFNAAKRRKRNLRNRT